MIDQRIQVLEDEHALSCELYSKHFRFLGSLQIWQHCISGGFSQEPSSALSALDRDLPRSLTRLGVGPDGRCANKFYFHSMV